MTYAKPSPAGKGDRKAVDEEKNKKLSLCTPTISRGEVSIPKSDGCRGGKEKGYAYVSSLTYAYPFSFPMPKCNLGGNARTFSALNNIHHYSKFSGGGGRGSPMRACRALGVHGSGEASLRKRGSPVKTPPRGAK